MTEQPDQLRAPENTATETTEPPEAVAARRILKLRRRHPEETPAQLTERLKQRFIRDFSLVGGAEVGATHLVPGAVATATRNPKIAGATRAAAQLGVVQGISTYTQKTAQGVSTAAHVGSSQTIKTYVHALALLHGIEVQDSDDAATKILDGDVHQLLRTLDQPIARKESQTGASVANVLSAVSAIGIRNPQMFLLVKSGEQLVRSGGSALDTSKARKEFAQQLAQQISQNLGPAPAEFPEQFRNIPVQEGVDRDAPLEPIEATPAEQVRATSPEELERIAQSNKASAKGARFAARAFMKGAAKARQFGQNRDSN